MVFKMFVQKVVEKVNSKVLVDFTINGINRTAVRTDSNSVLIVELDVKNPLADHL